MGGVLFQCGTAAHLALLTAAPLFLSVICGPGQHAMALLALSLFAAVWVVMNPSPRAGEYPRDARHRIGWELVRDPFLTFGAIALVLAVVRAINGGVGLDYDTASGLWRLKGAAVALLPGSVSGQGTVPLTGLLSLVIVTLGVRHALDSEARFCYLLYSGVLAAATVLCWWALSKHGFPLTGLIPGLEGTFSAGTLLGVYLLLAVAAWVRSWLSDSPFQELLAAASVAVLLSGLLVTASTFALLTFVLPAVLLVLAGVVFSLLNRAPVVWFRTVLSLAVVLVPIAGFAFGYLSRPVGWALFAEGFAACREAAISVALTALKESSQLGAGLGAYPFALGYHATSEDWRVLPATLTAVPCGWIHYIFERGLLGAVTLAAGLAILLRDVVLNYLRSGLVWPTAVSHLLGLVALIGVSAVLFVDSTFADPAALMPLAAALALTSASLSEIKESNNG